jgi:hypothetical protein
MKFPITAILPIYNCKERLARHLQSVTVWAETIQEIIVVDSGSRDGSLELAQEILTPLRARFLHNPPGLYQSWNAGIASATSPYTYISTVEDPITQRGLEHLMEVMTRYDADLVISPPEMKNHDGSETVVEKMPSNRLADSFLSNELKDRLLTRSESVALLCGFLPHGLLGSSASNLTRTSFLQQHPFPTDYGHCGDTAWGVAIAPLARIAFTTQHCAKFYCQTTFHAEDPSKQLARHRQLAALAFTSLKAEASHDPEVAVMLGWFESYDHSLQTLLSWLIREQVFKNQLEIMKAKYEGGILHYLLRAFRDESFKIFKK